MLPSYDRSLQADFLDTRRPYASASNTGGEIWVLRQQINVLRRAAPRRQSFGIFDRLIFVGLYRLFPKACDALAIVKPDTIIRWHRAGFRAYWRWKSRRRGGRPTVPPEIRKLIREMSIANALWGAPRIHGEFAQASASKSGRRVWPSIWPGGQAAVPRMEDIPPQSRRRHRRDGFCSSCRQSRFVLLCDAEPYDLSSAVAPRSAVHRADRNEIVPARRTRPSAAMRRRDCGGMFVPSLGRGPGPPGHILWPTLVCPDFDAELEQLSMDPRRSHSAISNAHLADKLAYLRRYSGRPPRRPDFQRQYALKPARCQRMIVSG